MSVSGDCHYCRLPMAYIVDPSPLLSNTENGIKEYTSKMLGRRALGVRRPVKPGMAFNISSFSPTLSSCPPEPARPLPDWFGRCNIYRVQLHQCLRTHDSFNDLESYEVWKGSLTPSPDYYTAPSADSWPPIPVAVRLVQPSMFHSPTSTHQLDPDQLARSKAATYDLLKDLQGTVIPYFFGKRPVSPLAHFGEPPI